MFHSNQIDSASSWCGLAGPQYNARRTGLAYKNDGLLAVHPKVSTESVYEIVEDSGMYLSKHRRHAILFDQCTIP